MKIKRIISQNRRDFQAVYECEHCEWGQIGPGYDDMHFHQHVVPTMPCPKCGKTAGDDYRPLAPKHPDGEVV